MDKKIKQPFGCLIFWLRRWDLNHTFLHFSLRRKCCGQFGGSDSRLRLSFTTASPSELFALRAHNPVFVRSYPLARKTKAPPFRTVLCFVWLRRWDLNLTFLHFLCGENAAVSSAALTCHRQVIHSRLALRVIRPSDS